MRPTPSHADKFAYWKNLAYIRSTTAISRWINSCQKSQMMEERSGEFNGFVSDLEKEQAQRRAKHYVELCWNDWQIKICLDVWYKMRRVSTDM